MTTKKAAKSFADLMDETDEEDFEPIKIAELPPLYAEADLKRTPRSLPIPDLSRFAKLWQLIGEGNTGKTMLARWLIEKIASRGKFAESMVAALAPGNRNLLDFAPGAMQPPSADPQATAEWALKGLRAMQKSRWSGVWDFGGGDTALRHMIQAAPDMATSAEEAGVAIVAAYLLSPRLDDLAFLRTNEALGYQPKATALILNRSRAASPSAFDALRRQPEYRAALDRGAVELWMPAMPQAVALAVERARVTFQQARDGEAPEGKRPAQLALTQQFLVSLWLKDMGTEFEPIESWLPWA